MKRLLILALPLVLCLPGAGLAGKVKSFNLSGPQAFGSGQRQGVALTSDGTLRLSAPLHRLADLPATTVWAIAADDQGNAYAATGGEGKLFRIDAAGSVTVLHQAADQQVLSLAVAAGGTLYAGTGPSGQILRIQRDGRAAIWCETGETYIWSLLYDEQREEVWAATGPRGRILRISAGGKVQERIETQQQHVLCLALRDRESYVAGTAPQGVVYQVARGAAPRPLFQCAQAEVRTLCWQNGRLYAGTSGVQARGSQGVIMPASLRDGGERASAADDEDSAESGERRAVSATPDFRRASEALIPGAASVASEPAAPRENSICRLDDNRQVRELIRLKGLVHAVVRRGDELLVGVGGNVARILSVNEQTNTTTEIARLDHGHVQCLLMLPDGDALVAGSDPARLYRLGRHHVAEGRFTADVFDARRFAHWGSLSWRAAMPPGTAVRLETRSGNVETPDETWSPWQAVAGSPGEAPTPSPPSRFLQVRVTLSTSNPQVSPELLSLQAYSQQINVAPEVTAIEVPDDERPAGDAGKKLKIKWSAGDPNEDELTYAVFYRKESWKSWIEAARDVRKREYEWDPRSLPTGRYQVRIVASDRPDNPPDEAAEGERISSTFVVDHVPPSVAVRVIGLADDRALVEASARDEWSRLVSAQFAVDGQPWQPAFPTDGVLDGKAKAFHFKTDGLRPGAHVIVFKVVDAAGNVGSADFVFEVRARR